MQGSTYAYLGASEHGGVLVTVQSSDPTRVLVSPDAATAGTASFTVNLANSQTYVPYYLQGLENVTGSANVTVSAPGFATGSHTVGVVPGGVEIINLQAATTTLSADDVGWYLQVGIPCAGNAQLCQVQPVRAGGPAFVVSLTLTPAQTPVAQLKSDQPVATGQSVTKPIPPGAYYSQPAAPGTSYGLALDPLGPGTTTVTATGPVGVLTLSTGVRSVTISGPGITMPGPTTVGAGLQGSTYAYLGASEHGGVLVTVQSSDPTRVLVSPDAATAGTASFTVNLANSQTYVPYYLQGLENVTGSANVTVSAPGFATGSHTVGVVPSAVEIANLNTNQTNLSAPDVGWYVQVGIPCTGNAQLCQVQPVRAGGPAFIVTLANTEANVARLSSDQPATTGQVVTKPIQPGIYYTQAVAAGTSYGLGFDPLSNGQTSVSVDGPDRDTDDERDRRTKRYGQLTGNQSNGIDCDCRIRPSGGRLRLSRRFPARGRHGDRHEQRAGGGTRIARQRSSRRGRLRDPRRQQRHVRPARGSGRRRRHGHGYRDPFRTWIHQRHDHGDRHTSCDRDSGSAHEHQCRKCECSRLVRAGRDSLYGQRAAVYRPKRPRRVAGIRSHPHEQHGSGGATRVG